MVGTLFGGISVGKMVLAFLLKMFDPLFKDGLDNLNSNLDLLLKLFLVAKLFGS